MQLLGHAGLRQLLAQHRTAVGGDDDDDDDDDDDMDYVGRLGSRRRRRPKCGKTQYPKVPSEEGQKLMDVGVFGTSAYYRDRRTKTKVKLSRKLLGRELGNDRGQTTRSTGAIAQVRRIAEKRGSPQVSALISNRT